MNNVSAKSGETKAAIWSRPSAALAALGVAFRPIQATDRPFLLSLFADLRHADFTHLPFTEDQKAAFMAAQFDAEQAQWRAAFPEADFMLVERVGVGARPISIGRFHLDRSQPVWRVIDIDFIPAQRGQGIGQATLDWILTEVASAQGEGLDLHVLATNVRAQALYSRLGFQMTDEGDGLFQHMLWRVGDAMTGGA